MQQQSLQLLQCSYGYSCIDAVLGKRQGTIQQIQKGQVGTRNDLWNADCVVFQGQENDQKAKEFIKLFYYYYSALWAKVQALLLSFAAVILTVLRATCWWVLWLEISSAESQMPMNGVQDTEDISSLPNCESFCS